MRIKSRHVDLQRGAKDIQLPVISRSRLTKACKLMSLPVLTVTTRDYDWSCDRDIDAFFTAVNRGRITHEDSNCRKTLLIMDWDVRTTVMNAHFRGAHTQYRRIPFTSYNTTTLCDNGVRNQVLNTSRRTSSEMFCLTSRLLISPLTLPSSCSFSSSDNSLVPTSAAWNPLK